MKSSFFSKNKNLSLRKARKILFYCLDRLDKKKHFLNRAQETGLIEKLRSLDSTIKEKNRQKASDLAKNLQKEFLILFPKTSFEKIFHFSGSILIALALAFVIRQAGLELYTIPTGSMRPTLKEKDLLIVSKTQYGLNIPGKTAHFYFDPTLVERGQIVVFTGEGMDIPDLDMRYFYLFPGKKQFVKRLIGKPKDYLYFYGGRIFGIDGEQKAIENFREKSFANLETIPMLQFEGKMRLFDDIVRLYHMNQPVAELTFHPTGLLLGKMVHSENVSSECGDLSDLWGIGNYAMARLLSEEETHRFFPEHVFENKTSFYLELRHHPSVQSLHLYHSEDGQKVRPLISFETSLLPLNEEAIDRLFSHLYTCRFQIKNHEIFGLSRQSSLDLFHFFPSEKEFPNGQFEILDGKAYQIYPLGISMPLTKNHFLNQKKTFSFFFNFGMEFHEAFCPKTPLDEFFPPRYAYYRNGDLYLFNEILYSKEDPILKLFVSEEKSHQGKGFLDNPPPMTKEGKIETAFLKTHGLKIPEGHYLVFGDNHAMSADSRVFGFVPENNLRGTVSFLFWPFSTRLGSLPQPALAWHHLPSVIFFSLSALAILAFWFFQKRRRAKYLK